MGGCSSRVKTRQEEMICSPWTDTRGTPLSFPHKSIAGKRRGNEKPWFCVLFYAVASVTHQVSSLKTFKNITNHSINSSGYHYVPSLHIFVQGKTAGSSSLPAHNLSRHLMKSTAFVPLRQVSTRSSWMFHKVSFGSHRYCRACFSLPTVESLLYPLSYKHISSSAADNSSLSGL